MGRHSTEQDGAATGRPAPPWTARTPGWKLLALALVVVITLMIGFGADQEAYWFQATPELTEPRDGVPSDPGPVVSLTVGPEQRPSRSSSPTPPPAVPPVQPAPAPRPSRADRGTPSRPAPATCQVAFRRGSSWEQGYTATVTVTNRGDRALGGWTVGWTYRGDQRIRNLWNGRLTQNGRAVQVRDEGWNAAIQPGGSVSFGFEASPASPDTDPDRFTLNGASCGAG